MFTRQRVFLVSLATWPAKSRVVVLSWSLPAHHARILRAWWAEENSDWAHLMGSSGTLSLPKGAVEPVRLALGWQVVSLRSC